MKTNINLPSLLLSAMIITVSMGGCTHNDSTLGTSYPISDNSQQWNYDDSDSIIIELTGTSAKCTHESVNINNSVITITGNETYTISGNLENGSIIVNAPSNAKPRLILKNAHITAANTAAVYISNADHVYITAADSTDNSLASTDFTDDNTIDGALFSKDDITLEGSGKLTISSDGHGIVCNDDLTVAGGMYDINSADNALDAHDSITLANSMITADAGNDGIHCENNDDSSKGSILIENSTLNITSQCDGISAENNIEINGGEISITTGGGSKVSENNMLDDFPPTGRPRQNKFNDNSAENTQPSSKGIKSKSSITINSGAFNIDAADDAIHSDISAVINGGSFSVKTSDDAIHCNEKLMITDGSIAVNQCYEGLEADIIEISGGTIDIYANDDGINAADSTSSNNIGRFEKGNSNIIISGGTLNVTAKGDCIDANGNLTVNGGNTVLQSGDRGDTAMLDYDRIAEINGGTFIATGSSSMAQSFSGGNQGYIAVICGKQAAGTKINVTDSNGDIIITHSPALSFKALIISTPQLVSNDTCTLTVGSSSQEFTIK